MSCGDTGLVFIDGSGDTGGGDETGATKMNW